jgi:DNA-binding NtrC family response regulator
VPSSTTSSPPLTLLFVDIDEAYVTVARHVLQTASGGPFTMIWKNNGPDGLAEIRSNPAIDLLILDHYVSESTGFDLLQRLKELKIDVPVILLTSQREFRLAVEALRLGVEEYLLKEDAVGPLLARTVVNVIERTRLRRQVTEQQKADIIERKRTDAMKELVVTVCHEFNNPLAAIKISTDILSRQWLSDNERRLIKELDESISRIEGEIQRLRDINFE